MEVGFFKLSLSFLSLSFSKPTKNDIPQTKKYFYFKIVASMKSASKNMRNTPWLRRISQLSGVIKSFENFRFFKISWNIFYIRVKWIRNSPKSLFIIWEIILKHYMFQNIVILLQNSEMFQNWNKNLQKWLSIK